MMDIKKTIANNIKRLRKEMGIGQEKLSDEAGIHRTHMSLIERGQSNMTIESLEKIAQALWVKSKELL